MVHNGTHFLEKWLQMVHDQKPFLMQKTLTGVAKKWWQMVTNGDKW